MPEIIAKDNSCKNIFKSLIDVQGPGIRLTIIFIKHNHHNLLKSAEKSVNTADFNTELSELRAGNSSMLLII